MESSDVVRMAVEAARGNLERIGPVRRLLAGLDGLRSTGGGEIRVFPRGTNGVSVWRDRVPDGTSIEFYVHSTEDGGFILTDPSVPIDVGSKTTRLGSAEEIATEIARLVGESWLDPEGL